MGTPRSKNQHILSIKKKYNLSKKNTVLFGDSITDLKISLKYEFPFIQVGNNLSSNLINLKIKNFLDKKLKKLIIIKRKKIRKIK